MKTIPSFDLAHNHGTIGETLVVRKFGPLPKGFKGPGHLHHEEHATFVAKGPVQIRIWNEGIWDGDPSEEYLVDSYNFIVVPKDKHHQIEAVEDGAVWYCIFTQNWNRRD